MSTLGPTVGGSSNVERTGTRDLCFSSALRRVPDVRHADLDMYQMCPSCKTVEVVFEASSDPRKASDWTRRIGRKLEAYSVLVIHHAQDTGHEHPVLISTWDPEGARELVKHEMSWAEFLQLLFNFHVSHIEECPRGVRRQLAA